MIAYAPTQLIAKLPRSVKTILRSKKQRFFTTNTPLVIFTNHPTPLDLTLNHLTIGTSDHCYLPISRDVYHFPFRTGTVNQIEIRDFLDNFSDLSHLENFFIECHRILKSDGILNLAHQILHDSATDPGSLRHLWDTAPSWCQTSSQLDTWITQTESKYRGFFPVGLIKATMTKYYLSESDDRFAKLDLISQPIALPSLNQVSGIHNVYLGYGDPIALVAKLKSRLNDPFFQGRKFITVGGSGMYLNLLPYLNPSSVVIYDINPLQINYTKILLQLIKRSASREQFLSRLFSRPYHPNHQQFLRQPHDPKLFAQTKKMVGKMTSFDETIGSIALGEYTEFSPELYGLKIASNSYCQYLTVSKQQGFYPGTNINYWCLHEGFLKNKQSYTKVKQALEKAKVITASLDDPVLLKEYDHNSIAYVTNIGEVDWLRGELTQVSDEQAYIAKVSRLVPNVGQDFIQAWRNEYRGFINFINKERYNTWIIDVMGNITSMKTIEKNRLSAHNWLWKYLEPHLVGRSLEIIHLPDNTWGFTEHLPSVSYQKFLGSSKFKNDALITHLLLENGVSLKQFIAVLTKASSLCKKLIIIERYSGGHASSLSLDDLITHITQIDNLATSHITIEVTGAGRPDQSSGLKPTSLRNLIITCTI